MSWHPPYQRTALHQALSAALMCSISTATLLSTAQAATVGKTTVTSAQYEPLVASIEISDIQTADFGASLASPVVYQQMGLTPTASMSLKFVPTSATAGRLVITTSQPVSAPFADIVLAINDGSRRNTVPKTLLMPLVTSVPVNRADSVNAISSTKQSFNQVLASRSKPNLPIVSAPIAVPLTLRRGAPPPLFATTTMQAPIQASTITPASAMSVAALTNLPTLTLSPPLQTITRAKASVIQPNADSINANALSATNQQDVKQMPDAIINNSTADLEDQLNFVAPSTEVDVQQRVVQKGIVQHQIAQQQAAQAKVAQSNLLTSTVLNIQITRQITAYIDKNNKVASDKSATSPFLVDPVAKGDSTSLTDASTLTAQPTATSSMPVSDGAATNQRLSSLESNATESLAADPNLTTVNYTVQRNDNLWVISKQLAQKNNLDVRMVMKQIQAQNPEAFIDKDASLLRAHAQLSLPNYEVVPSEQSLQSAIAAQKRSTARATDADTDALKTSNLAKTTTKATNDTNDTTSIAKPIDTPTTTTKTLSQPRFSALAPGHKGSADGTQTQAAAAGNGLSTDVLLH